MKNKFQIFRLPEADVGESESEMENANEMTELIETFVSPRFVIPPKDTFILSNQTGKIEARIYSIPKPIVRWYQNGQLITSSLFPKIKVPKMNKQLQGTNTKHGFHSFFFFRSIIANLKHTFWKSQKRQPLIWDRTLALLETVMEAFQRQQLFESPIWKPKNVHDF